MLSQMLRFIDNLHLNRIKIDGIERVCINSYCSRHCALMYCVHNGKLTGIWNAYSFFFFFVRVRVCVSIICFQNPLLKYLFEFHWIRCAVARRRSCLRGQLETRHFLLIQICWQQIYVAPN